MTYPTVLDEFETLSLLTLGHSIARFGDGEFKLVDGKEYVREARNSALTAEIRDVLYNAPDNCFVGIPTMDPKGPKYAAGWAPRIGRFTRWLERCPEKYFVSSLITRPDSAPWIDTPEYARVFESLWKGKRVAVLCENNGSALRLIRRGADLCKWVECPHEGAYAQIAEFEEQIVEDKPDIAILSCGPTATCLAARLARHGVQAIDFGSAGSFLLRHLYP